MPLHHVSDQLRVYDQRRDTCVLQRIARQGVTFSRNCTCYRAIGASFDADSVLLLPPDDREQGHQSHLLTGPSPGTETRSAEGAIAHVGECTEIQASRWIARDLDDVQHGVQSAVLEENLKIRRTSCHAFPNSPKVLQQKSFVLQDYRTNCSRNNHRKMLVEFRIQDSIQHRQ